jgi:hypothetical protein
VWDPALADALLPAAEEPLPARAQAWLERRLGLAAPAGRGEWEQDDWEADAASRVDSWLRSGEPQQALAVLNERTGRLPGSRLFAREVAVATACGDLGRAEAALQRGMASAVGDNDRAAQLDLAEQAVVLRARQRDPAGLITAARTAVTLADLAGDRIRAVDVLVRGVAELQDLGAPVDELLPELSARFTRLPRSQLRAQPELVRRVLHAAGPYDSAVLLHAAEHLGDQTAEDGVFRPDAFALGRLLDTMTVSDRSRTALDQLAGAVGLTPARSSPSERPVVRGTVPDLGPEWGIADLASRAVRGGRTGQAVTLGLGFTADEGSARRMVVDELVRPVTAPPTTGGATWDSLTWTT